MSEAITPNPTITIPNATAATTNTDIMITISSPPNPVDPSYHLSTHPRTSEHGRAPQSVGQDRNARAKGRILASLRGGR